MGRRNAMRFAALSVAFAAFLPPVQQARADASKIGTLECFVDAGGSYIVGASTDVSCVLYGRNDEALENYVGELKKYGVDIGFTEETLLAWDVFVATGKAYTPGSLAGGFAGATANASIAFGLGASILIGGLSESFALQPVQIARQKGINIAIGITRMQLRQVTIAPEGGESEPDTAQ